MWSRVSIRSLGLSRRSLFDTIKYEEKGAVGLITLNQPKKLNAMSGVTYQEVPQALQKAAANEQIKVVGITGSGKFYTSGKSHHTVNFQNFQNAKNENKETTCRRWRIRWQILT